MSVIPLLQWILIKGKHSINIHSLENGDWKADCSSRGCRSHPEVTAWQSPNNKMLFYFPQILLDLEVSQNASLLSGWAPWWCTPAWAQVCIAQGTGLRKFSAEQTLLFVGSAGIFSLCGEKGPSSPTASHVALDCELWENGKSMSFPKEESQGQGGSPGNDQTPLGRLLNMQVARPHPGPAESKSFCPEAWK